MTEPKILFDAVEYSASSSGSFLSIILSLALPCMLIFFGVRAFRKAETKGAKGIGGAVGLVGLVLFLTGLGSLLTDPLSAEYRQRIESKDYSEVEGAITKLTESTMLAGNPAATFEVSEHVFEYGRGSANYELDMVEKDGILANEIPVKILFKDDKILRVYSLPETNNKKPSNKAEMATPRKPSD